MEIELELTSHMLGTTSMEKEMHAKYVAKRIKDAGGEELLIEELDTVPEDEMLKDDQRRGWTSFHKDDTGIFIYDYMIRGFLKHAFKVGMEITTIDKVTAYQDALNNICFIQPRRIYIPNGDGTLMQEPDGKLERSLRAPTPKGPRVSLARSDYLKAGRKIKFSMVILVPTREKVPEGSELDEKALKKIKNRRIRWGDVLQAFEYGRFVGLGQWRGSGGYGQFNLHKYSTVKRMVPKAMKREIKFETVEVGPSESSA